MIENYWIERLKRIPPGGGFRITRLLTIEEGMLLSMACDELHLEIVTRLSPLMTEIVARVYPVDEMVPLLPSDFVEQPFKWN